MIGNLASYKIFRLLILIVLFFGSENISAQNKDLFCKTKIAVGVTASTDIDGNYWASNIANELSQRTEIKGISVGVKNNENLIIDNGKREKSDFILIVKFERKTDNKNVQNSICGPLFGRNCANPEYKYTLNYKLINVETNQLVSENIFVGKQNKNESAAALEVSNLLNSEVIRKITEASPTARFLERKNLCFNGFYNQPTSLVLKYNLTTNSKKVAFDYYLKGNLWRVDIRPLGASTAFITAFNGKQVWSINKNDGGIISNIQKPENQIGVLLSDFLNNADPSNLRNEILRSSVIGKENIDGKICHIVKSRTRDETFTLSYFDQNTGALTKKKILNENEQLEEEITYQEYNEVINGNGTMFPYKITAKDKSNITIIEVSQFIYNAKIVDSWFIKP